MKRHLTIPSPHTASVPKAQIFSLFTFLFSLTPKVSAQVAHYDMSLTNGNVTELISKSQHKVNSQLPAFTVDAIDGQALRFDGYSNFITASLPTASFNADALTITILLAPETYPMMNVNEAENTPTYGLICGNLDDAAKTGFAFELSSQGHLRFRFGTNNGFLYTIDASSRLPRGKWSRITATLDKANAVATLYLDGTSVGTTRMRGVSAACGQTTFLIGKSSAELKAFGANINTYCGLIDDIAIYNKAMTANEIAALVPDGSTIGYSIPDFTYPASRYTYPSSSPLGGNEGGLGVQSLWRPQFHGMPSGSWTNETHGMAYSDGRYHVFFQKNANGPYMARLHWGHISSDNLYKWREEPIAFGPSESYDIKGCWSGCVFTDNQLTNGKPAALYTAVDNAKATICLATPDDDALLSWSKSSANPLVNGRPGGLSDDFRDPYFFTANGEKYIIVGTSKNDIGACTLHKYVNGAWTNDGTLFFQGGSRSQHGRFWEMPNITRMDNEKYLFTVTPLDINNGVHTIYWIGTISPDGKFQPETTAQPLEMAGISRDGYGLLSPTFLGSSSLPTRSGSLPTGRAGGESAGGESSLLMLGIVPDKLPTEQNLQMGWAHNYSLPREVSLNTDNTLIQKPYSGLTAMRSDVSYSHNGEIIGAQSLAPVSGRQIELLADFTVGTSAFGFNFLKSGSQQASLTYDPALGTLTLDLTALKRFVNDGVYGGKYTVTLPKKPAAGETLHINIFLDGSIADIFVANKWAYSVRLFPTDPSSVEAEVFANGTTQVNVSAWNLNPDLTSGIMPIISDVNANASVACYNLLGQHVPANTTGIVIQNGRKYINR